MSRFENRDAVMPWIPKVRTPGGDRHHAGAHFVEAEEDPCADHKLVDPLDDRDWRCAFRTRAR